MRILFALALAQTLAACVAPAPGERAASLTAPPSLELARFDPSAEGVEIAPPEGAAVPMAKLLQRSVAAALGRYNVPASYSSGAGRYLLSGHAGPNRDTAQAAVVAIEWRIFDRRQGREAGRFTLPVVGDQFAWDHGDPRVIAQVGDETSRRLVQLIDGARPVAAVNHGPRDAPGAQAPKPEDPAASFAPGPSLGRPSPPGAQAPKTIDPAAISAPGPSLGRPSPPAPPSSAALAPRPVSQSASPPSARTAAGPTVFLVRVGGAPGDGDAALARAARAAFEVGGFSPAAGREDARYIVAGSVNVAAPAEGRQAIRIVWEVSSPDGRPLGRAVQENAVPAGSLNGTWGPMASLVAGAAVAGITDVIGRSKETAARAGLTPRESNDPPLSGRAAPSVTAERRLKIPPPGAQAPKPEDPAASFAPDLSSGRPPPPGAQAPKPEDPAAFIAPDLLFDRSLPPPAGISRPAGKARAPG